MGEDLLLLTAETYSFLALLAVLTVSAVFAGVYAISPTGAVATARAVLFHFFTPINQKDPHEHQNLDTTNRDKADCPHTWLVYPCQGPSHRNQAQEPVGYNLQDLLDRIHQP